VSDNPIGLDGMEFIEYAGRDTNFYHDLLSKFGFQKIGKHKTKEVFLYRQGEINFVVNEEAGSFADHFQGEHGPSACATGFRVFDAQKAYDEAIKRGAKAYTGESKYPAIYGIGESLVYFIDKYGDKGSIFEDDFDLEVDFKTPLKGAGLTTIDHMTNNVPMGDMDKWANFYFDIFNFREIRFFDIQGAQTGLLSRALRSPCNKITIPINEPKDPKSQIQEYLDEYKGPGIQHIALETDDICSTVKSLRENDIAFLDVPDTYYEMLPDRLPNITEDMGTLQSLKLLADGDPEGYLLQIFTQNLVGPIFIEIIQRKNHFGFGEGNFQALFDAIERDQKRRGVL
jgi:4-hydroxyphenylpyruvate dioxygenase